MFGWLAKRLSEYRERRRLRAMLSRPNSAAALLRSIKIPEKELAALAKHVDALEADSSEHETPPDLALLSESERKEIRKTIRGLERSHAQFVKQIERHLEKAEDWRRKAAKAAKAGYPELVAQADGRAEENVAAAEQFRIEEAELRRLLARLRDSLPELL